MQQIDNLGPSDRTVGTEDIEGQVRCLTERLAAAQVQIDNLQVALQSARVIGAAVGIVMALEKIPYDDAFAQLVSASQRQGRKLREVADDVALYGSVVGRSTQDQRLAG